MRHLFHIKTHRSLATVHICNAIKIFRWRRLKADKFNLLGLSRAPTDEQVIRGLLLLHISLRFRVLLKQLFTILYFPSAVDEISHASEGYDDQDEHDDHHWVTLGLCPILIGIAFFLIH